MDEVHLAVGVAVVAHPEHVPDPLGPAVDAAVAVGILRVVAPGPVDVRGLEALGALGPGDELLFLARGGLGGGVLARKEPDAAGLLAGAELHLVGLLEALVQAAGDEARLDPGEALVEARGDGEVLGLVGLHQAVAHRGVDRDLGRVGGDHRQIGDGVAGVGQPEDAPLAVGGWALVLPGQFDLGQLHMDRHLGLVVEAVVGDDADGDAVVLGVHVLGAEAEQELALLPRGQFKRLVLGPLADEAHQHQRVLGPAAFEPDLERDLAVVAHADTDLLVVVAADVGPIAGLAEGKALDPGEGPHRPLPLSAEGLELVGDGRFEPGEGHAAVAPALADGLLPGLFALLAVADLGRPEARTRPTHLDPLAGEYGPVRRGQAKLLGQAELAAQLGLDPRGIAGADLQAVLARRQGPPIHGGLEGGVVVGGQRLTVQGEGHLGDAAAVVAQGLGAQVERGIQDLALGGCRQEQGDAGPILGARGLDPEPLARPLPPGPGTQGLDRVDTRLLEGEGLGLIIA